MRYIPINYYGEETDEQRPYSKMFGGGSQYQRPTPLQAQFPTVGDSPPMFQPQQNEGGSWLDSLLKKRQPQPMMGDMGGEHMGQAEDVQSLGGAAQGGGIGSAIKGAGGKVMDIIGM